MKKSPFCRIATRVSVAVAMALTAGAAQASWFSDLTFSDFTVSWSGYQSFNGAPSDGLSHTVSIPEMKFPSGTGSYSIGGVAGENSHVELSGTMEIHGSLDACGDGPYDFAYLRFFGRVGMASFEDPGSFHSCNDGQPTTFSGRRTFRIGWDASYSDGEYIQATIQADNFFSFENASPVPEPSAYLLLLAGLAPLTLVGRKHFRPVLPPG